MSSASTDPAVMEKFWDMASEFQTCMMVTRDGNKMRARPMQPHVAKDRQAILFVTDKNSDKCGEVDSEQETCLTFEKPGKWLSVSGQASVSTAADLKDIVWDNQAEAWMAQGKDDPSVAVVVIRPSRAEMWNVESNKVAQAWEFAKAYTGVQDRPNVPSNEKVALNA
jgi:general stress protein 26